MGGNSHALLVLPFFQHILRHGDVRERTEADGEDSEGDRLVEELDGRVVFLLEWRSPCVRLRSISLQNLSSHLSLANQQTSRDKNVHHTLHSKSKFEYQNALHGNSWQCHSQCTGVPFNPGFGSISVSRGESISESSG